MNTPNPYAPPSAPVRDLPTAGGQGALADRGTRLGATILDGLIFAALVYLPLILGTGIRNIIGADRKVNYAALLTGPGTILAAIGLCIFVALTLRFVLRNGQTIGKKLLGIKVIRSDGSRAGLGRLFWLRNVVLTAISAIPILGYLVALADSLLIFRESRQCLHDQIADTIVIKA
jgi:uncharacterized RDD family membrane protein YckC